MVYIGKIIISDPKFEIPGSHCSKTIEKWKCSCWAEIWWDWDEIGPGGKVEGQNSNLMTPNSENQLKPLKTDLKSNYSDGLEISHRVQIDHQEFKSNDPKFWKSS